MGIKFPLFKFKLFSYISSKTACDHSRKTLGSLLNWHFSSYVHEDFCMGLISFKKTKVAIWLTLADSNSRLPTLSIGKFNLHIFYVANYCKLLWYSWFTQALKCPLIRKFWFLLLDKVLEFYLWLLAFLGLTIEFFFPKPLEREKLWL